MGTNCSQWAVATALTVAREQQAHDLIHRSRMYAQLYMVQKSSDKVFVIGTHTNKKNQEAVRPVPMIRVRGEVL